MPIEFPVIDRKRLLQLVKENQLQLDENELPHAVHFLNESGLFQNFVSKFSKTWLWSFVQMNLNLATIYIQYSTG